MKKGKVYIIGAGPGDEELLTLKAVKKLKECSLVMYDRLAGAGVLNYLNEDCGIYYCGKEPGCHYRTQEEINEMLVKFAEEGYIVGRIKGGDPYIFGRGGEEVLALSRKKIDFEVIPGITSFISVLNYAGIPVTHRNVAQSFHVFTGKAAENLHIDWKAAAAVGGTLVFMMAFSSLGEIANRLIENGMNEDTSCAVVMEGTTARQRKVISNLKEVYHDAVEGELHSPCIFVVGEVVKFSSTFSWYEEKPLFGRNICITRSKSQSGEMKGKLMDLGAQVTEIHSIRIKSTNDNMVEYIDRLPLYDYIVFTSVNGVNSFFELLLRKNYDVRNIKAVFAAIGPATEREIRRRGIIPEIVAEKFVAESLYDKLKNFISPGNRIFLPRSKNSRPYLSQVLKEYGCVVDECPVYETLCGDIYDPHCFDDVDTVVFTSPTTVRNMMELVGIEAIREKYIVAIGPITGKELKKNNLKYTMSETYTEDGIIKKLREKRRM